MKINWRGFKSDPYFFLKYFFTQMAFSLLLLAGLYFFLDSPGTNLQLALWHLPIALAAVVLGIQLPSILHNAVHYNLRPLWLNEVVGEILGFFVLFGLGPFRISHFLHHAFADSGRDPHPPAGKGFVRFLVMTQISTIEVIREEFLKAHGRNWKMHAVLVSEMAFYYVSLVARIGCWYWLLGPTWMLVLFAPAYITNVLVFAHINFATHRTNEDGSVEIINLNHNLWYRTVNFFGHGVYFHKNHHIKPNLYDPSRLSVIPSAKRVGDLRRDARRASRWA